MRAFEQLMRAHEHVAFRAAHAVTRNHADAEEAVQEAFLNAYRSLRRFRRGLPFRPWLLRIVLNEAKDRRHAAARARGLAERADQEAGARAEAPATVPVIDAERRSLLLAALDRLPAKQRDVVTCRYLLELSEEETAATLSLRPGTVKSRLSRALTRLEADLEGAL